MSYFEHLVACKLAEDAAYKIAELEAHVSLLQNSNLTICKERDDKRMELEAEVSRLKTIISDRESTIVSQQEELWRLRDIVGGRW